MADTIAKILFLFLFLTAGLHAENLNPQFLELGSIPRKTSDTLIFMQGITDSYWVGKENILIPETEREIARFSVYPSFVGPYGIRLFSRLSTEPKEAEPGKPALPAGVPLYRLMLATAPKGIKVSKAKEGEKAKLEAEVERIERGISKNFAVAIQRVWFRALLGARYPQQYELGLDGTIYIFSAGQMKGLTWSPDKGLMIELVKLSEGLKPFITDDNIEENDLVKKWQAFEAHLIEAD